MAWIELGLAVMGFMSIRRMSKAHVFDCWSILLLVQQIHLRYLNHPMERVRIEPRALICPAKVKADACSIGGNTLRVYSYTFIRTQSYVCLFACGCVCAQCSWLCVQLKYPSTIHAPASCLPGIMLVSVRTFQSISYSCFVWHFVCLVFLLCFLPCLGWPRLKTIRYHDLTF